MPIKNIIPGQQVTSEKVQRARELRREMTPAEKILWNELRGNKLGLRVIRIQNKEVIKNLPQVLKQISNHLLISEETAS
jgi:very-short-patch-repair endonuclease